MYQELRDTILAFDLDSPASEYGFSTRLASENYWTTEFTRQAVLEYKKFMYLAATSDLMVSPSEIIDVVWHQHLIFTQSYQDFCNLAGKQIQHVPSTHNREEFDKFRQAKERTIKLYESHFGPQPKNIWGYNDMFESLNLKKARFKIRTFLIFGILAFMILTVPAWFLLKPVYIHINNPDFIIGFAGLVLCTLVALEIYNQRRLKKIIAGADSTSFIFELQPYELVYAKSQELQQVINGHVNELIEAGIIQVNTNNTLELSESNATSNREQLQITSVLHESGRISYPALLRKLMAKPVFRNTAGCLDAFRKYFNKSRKFGFLFYTNFAVLAVLLLLSFTRVATGVLRDKPVSQIVLATVILAVITAAFLHRLTKQICTTTLPRLYKKDILPGRQTANNWQWTYFLSGPAVLAASFLPLTRIADSNNSSGSSDGSSCSSGCGSSCSSCGGCGGS